MLQILLSVSPNRQEKTKAYLSFPIISRRDNGQDQCLNHRSAHHSNPHTLIHSIHKSSQSRTFYGEIWLNTYKSISMALHSVKIWFNFPSKWNINLWRNLQQCRTVAANLGEIQKVFRPSSSCQYLYKPLLLADQIQQLHLNGDIIGNDSIRKSNLKFRTLIL